MRRKLKIWTKRYLPAEIFGTLGAIVFPTLASFLTANVVVIAFVGTWGENVGFYGTMLFQEMRESKHQGFKALRKSLRNIFLEFGVAETVDSLFLRPAVMFFTVSYFDNLQLGLPVGKIAADVIFYIPAVISYELRKKHLGD